MNQIEQRVSLTQLDESEVPGGVYLCQVNETVSCGACCGLYNVANTSRDYLVHLLQERTCRFAKTPRTAEGIDAFAQVTTSKESQKRPFEMFHHCPFIGLIDDHMTRVGCLLHPLGKGNNSVDFRGLSYYGGMACHSYFCPATHQMAARHKKILRTIIDDWYLYGLVVTEGDLTTALFSSIEKKLGHTIDAEQFEHHHEAAKSLVQLLRLKVDWPYRPPLADTPCHYFFFDVSYEKPVIDYKELGAPPSRYDIMLRELVSQFRSTRELRQAEQRIEKGIAEITRILGAA